MTCRTRPGCSAAATRSRPASTPWAGPSSVTTTIRSGPSSRARTSASTSIASSCAWAGSAARTRRTTWSTSSAGARSTSTPSTPNSTPSAVAAARTGRVAMARTEPIATPSWSASAIDDPDSRTRRPVGRVGRRRTPSNENGTRVPASSLTSRACNAASSSAGCTANRSGSTADRTSAYRSSPCSHSATSPWKAGP